MMTEDQTSKPTATHLPCKDCGSSDALAEYSDGHTYCFSCGKNTPASTERKATPVTDEEEEAPVNPGLEAPGGVIPYEPTAINVRRIQKETAERWSYGRGTYRGRICQVACYFGRDGDVTAQKLRFRDKRFLMVGDSSRGVRLFGQQLWGESGNRVVIVEGELDAMALSQCLGSKHPVVSVPGGAKTAKKYIEQALEWLERFKSVVFCLDMDEHGQAAARECAALLSPRKAKIARLPLKDACDMVVARREKELTEAIDQAHTYRPDGVLSGEEVWQKIIADDEVPSIEYPWPQLQEMTRGIRGGEIVVLTAGSGTGKSAIARELAHHLRLHGQRVGYIALEESIKRTALGLLGIAVDQPLWLEPDRISEERLREVFDDVIGDGDVVLYDHFGSMEDDNLLSRVRYMVKACGVQVVFLDHLSIVVSGLDEGDERRKLDNIMTRLRSLVQETGVAMVVVSHLKRPDGKGHEDGARTALSQLRGTAGIGQLSDIVIGAERDQQDPDTREITTLRLLKNRYTGMTGEAGFLRYSTLTGRLRAYDPLDVADHVDTSGSEDELDSSAPEPVADDASGKKEEDEF